MSFKGSGMNGTGGEGGRSSYVQKRLAHMQVTIIVMIISFVLYYLGFFGTVEGPLDPAGLGARLSGIGVTRVHVLGLLALFFVVALTWNWVFNGIVSLAGARRTCMKKTGPNGEVCGAPVKKVKTLHKKHGYVMARFVCSRGHMLAASHFEPVRKGTVAHTAWITALVLLVIGIHASLGGV